MKINRSAYVESYTVNGISKNNRSKARGGLVLLVVLGMLALFSLLAISYLTLSSNSRNATASLTRAKLAKPATDNLPDMVVRQLISGVNDNRSGMYGHGMLEDIYGRDSIEGVFLPGSAALNRYTGSGATILKLQLDPRIDINPDPFRATPVEATTPTNNWRQSLLSCESDTYAGRLITFLGGPLENQTYRILGYWGYPGPMSTGASPTEQTYLRFAIAIDLAETDHKTFRAVNANRRAAGSLQEWIDLGVTNGVGPNLLIQDNTGAAYPFVINDLPFNGFGYGVEGDSNNPSFGNLDQGLLVPDPLNLTGTGRGAFPVTLPLALLPHYDYVERNRSNTYDTGVLGQLGGIEVRGSSNEGFDVPDYHDFWLSFVPEGAIAATPAAIQPPPTTAEIIPAFHRPELVNYIAQTYAPAFSSLNKFDLYRMVQLIDYACARPLSYHLRDTSGGAGALPEIRRNLGFEGRLDGRGIPTLDIDVANLVNSKLEIQEWVGKLIGRGPVGDIAAWDVDNEGTGVADSVWVDPNLPLVTSPDGKPLKVLAAPLVLDMDGRLNLNAIGDAIQGNSFAVAGTGSYHSLSETGADSALVRNGIFLPQGLGYGPAEISAAGFFINGNVTQRESRYANFFGFRYGADFGAGNSTLGGAAFDDLIGRFFKQRGITKSPFALPIAATHLGLQQSRRGQIAYGIDRRGNSRMSDSSSPSARTYINTNPSNPYPECFDDPYETSPNRISSNDTEITLAELESILRRYDRDSEAVSQRLKDFVKTELGQTNLTHAIYSAISTRSNELRYPNMAAIARHNRAYLNPYSPMINNGPIPIGTPRNTLPPSTMPPYAIPVPAGGNPTRLITNGRNEGSFLRWVQLLHQERYPSPPLALEMNDIKLLFPLEFRKALRLDINRPFGNGVDGDGDGNIDEPEELSSVLMSAAATPQPSEKERYPNSPTIVDGNYVPLIDDFPVIAPGLTPNEINRYINPLRSRKLLTRQLYCLAQLVIAPDYPFGGVASGDPNYVAFRARELAQWAVNVVDFRDTDGAMTRFEYDSTPFAQDGGDVFPAGHPRAGAPMVWLPEPGNVVWGMEFPELLMTETLAFHDKRIRDSSNDDDASGMPTNTTGSPADEDFDQYRIPQGSLFIELFCPRSNEISMAGNTSMSLGSAPQGRPHDIANSTYPTFLPAPVGRLYALNASGVPVLQLDATTPTDSAPAPPPSTGEYGPQPVFRIGISHPIRPGSGEFPEVNPAVTLATGVFPAKFQYTHQTSQFGAVSPLGVANGYTTTGLINHLTVPAEIPTFDRMIWFNATPGSAPGVLQVPDLEGPFDTSAAGLTNRGARIFHNAGAAVGLEPGRYLVVGPRATTYIGSNVTATPLLPLHEPSSQSIILGPGTVTINDMGGAIGTPGMPRAVPPNIQPPATMIAISEPPAPAGPWLAAPDGPLSVNGGVGLNISEPLAIAGTYYPMPTFRLNSGDLDGADGAGPIPGFAALPQDAYNDLSAAGNTFPDEPFDHSPATNPVLATPGFERFSKQTHANERVAYLQRVADPELPYHPLYNPYITIDWMSLDLTVFSGEDNATDDPDDMTDYTSLAFQSRYKDGARVNEVSMTPGVGAPGPRPTTRNAAPTATPQTGVSIFSTSTADLRGNVIQPVGTAPGERYFNYELGFEDPALETAATPYSSVTLGYLNQGRQLGPGANDWDGFGLPQPNANPYYVGAPLNVQAGLFWFNRAFVNPNELMLVPRTAPGQFGDSMTTPKSAMPAERYYTAAAVPSAALPSPYGYLPAFFSSVASKVTQPTGTAPYVPFWQQSSTASSGANWNLMLELVETAPPFADSDRWVDPAWFEIGGVTPTDYVRAYLLGGYRAPFNALPTYQTPGKVNVNTIARREVWDAVEWNYDATSRNQLLSAGRSQTSGGPWEVLKVARRGYNINSNVGSFFDTHPTSRDSLINPFLDANVPTQFAGAFRPGFGANVDVAAATAPTPPPRMVRSQRSVASSLLRPETGYAIDPQQMAGGANGPFSITPPPPSPPPPLPTPSSTNMLISPTPSPTVNPEIANQPFVNYQRAMRLPNLVTNQSNVFAVWVTIGLFEYDEVNGIGAEYIGPSGTPERSKSFYIIDRSIPVGFAPGKSYNSDKTILLRRKIPR